MVLTPRPHCDPHNSWLCRFPIFPVSSICPLLFHSHYYLVSSTPFLALAWPIGTVSWFFPVWKSGCLKSFLHTISKFTFLKEIKGVIPATPNKILLKFPNCKKNKVEILPCLSLPTSPCLIYSTVAYHFHKPDWYFLTYHHFHTFPWARILSQITSHLCDICSPSKILPWS